MTQQPTDQTWREQINRACTLPSEELERHALISALNKHQCEDCFTCAAFHVLELRERMGSYRTQDARLRAAFWFNR